MNKGERVYEFVTFIYGILIQYIFINKHHKYLGTNTWFQALFQQIRIFYDITTALHFFCVIMR